MCFPTIHLDAVNKTAALLLGRKDKCSADETTALQEDLIAKLAEIDSSISAIEGQLATRSADVEWRGSATRALRGYKLQRHSVCDALSTVRQILKAIASNNIAVVAVEKQEARMARIEASNTTTNAWNIEFRRVCREVLGQEEFQKLVEETDRRINATDKTD